MYYAITLAVSLILSTIYFFKRSKYSDNVVPFIYILSPLSIMGYYLISKSATVEEATVANIVNYAGSCFLPLLVFFTVASLCRVNLPKVGTSIAV